MSLNWIVNRLREPSTWRGLIWLATAAGVSLSPDAWAYITTIGMAVAGLIGVITREEPTRVDIHLPPPIELVGRPGMVDGSGPVADSHSTADSLRRPVRPVDYPVRNSNTDEAADHNDFPGWGS